MNEKQRLIKEIEQAPDFLVKERSLRFFAIK